MIPKRPPLSSPRHCVYVAQHCCVVCNSGYLEEAPDPTQPYSQCAHVNYLGRKHEGMRGKGTRVSDAWTVPICPWHHTDQTHEGHSGEKERAWWSQHKIDPEPICIELAENSPDPQVRAAAAELREKAA